MWLSQDNVCSNVCHHVLCCMCQMTDWQDNKVSGNMTCIVIHSVACLTCCLKSKPSLVLVYTLSLSHTHSYSHTHTHTHTHTFIQALTHTNLYAYIPIYTLQIKYHLLTFEIKSSILDTCYYYGYHNGNKEVLVHYLQGLLGRTASSQVLMINHVHFWINKMCQK